MKEIKSILLKALIIFLIFTFVCGFLYTGLVTGIAQLLFPDKANGSIIEVDGKRYGCALLGQQYTDDAHMWGRIMNIDVSTFRDEDGNTLMYASPSNLSPASEEYKALVAERVERLRDANPEMGDTAIPVDLVTCSGSGLDPHISPAAADTACSDAAALTASPGAFLSAVLPDTAGSLPAHPVKSSTSSRNGKILFFLIVSPPLKAGIPFSTHSQ